MSLSASKYLKSFNIPKDAQLRILDKDIVPMSRYYYANPYAEDEAALKSMVEKLKKMDSKCTFVTAAQPVKNDPFSVQAILDLKRKMDNTFFIGVDSATGNDMTRIVKFNKNGYSSQKHIADIAALILEYDEAELARCNPIRSTSGEVDEVVHSIRLQDQDFLLEIEYRTSKDEFYFNLQPYAKDRVFYSVDSEALRNADGETPLSTISILLDCLRFWADDPNYGA